MQLHGMGFALYEGEVSEGNTAWTIGDNHPYSEGCKEGKQHMPAELRMNTALQAISRARLSVIAMVVWKRYGWWPSTLAPGPSL
jgi:hypothetical protein